MQKDWKGSAGKTVLRVDGGMVASDWTMQRLADILDAPVDRPTDPGDDGARRGLACRLAGRRLAEAGEFAQILGARPPLRAGDGCRHARAKLKGWRDAVRRTLTRG